MSDRVAIRVEHLGKRYQIGAQQHRYRTMRESLISTVAATFRRFPTSTIESHNRQSDTIWALKDVSFEIKPGEVVGVIGRNGAGKSTLLKILSHITEPTEGRVTLHGRVGSLLEVGTGFHPELTGRENIYLNGAILGMRRAEIERKFDEIVAFSEIDKLLDTPVKRYSSGMYVRLAFAVAAFMEPEILLVDEVLAVGDAAFQRKCLGKMGDVANEGRTVLLVSHNMAAILKLCQKCMLLREGGLDLEGDTSAVVERYNSEGMLAQGERGWTSLTDAPGNDEVRLLAVRIINNAGKVSGMLDISQDYRLQMDYQVLKRASNMALVVRFCHSDGTVVFQTGDLDNQDPMLVREPGHYTSECVVPGNLLNSGSFFLNAYGHVPHVRSVFAAERVLHFEVLQTDYLGGEHERRLGPVRPLLEWTIKRLDQ